MSKPLIRSTFLSLPFTVFAAGQIHADPIDETTPHPSEFSVIIDASDTQPVGGEVSACTADGQMRILGYFTLSALPEDLEEISANPENHFDEIYHLEAVASTALQTSIASMPAGQIMEEDGYRQLMRRVFRAIDNINDREENPEEEVMGLGLNFQPTELQTTNHGCPQPRFFKA